MTSGSSVLLVYGGTVVVSRIILAKVPDRVPALPLIAGSLGLVATGSLALGLVGQPLLYLAAAALVGLGTALLTPAVFVAAFSVVPASVPGAFLSVAPANAAVGGLVLMSALRTRRR